MHTVNLGTSYVSVNNTHDSPTSDTFACVQVESRRMFAGLMSKWINCTHPSTSQVSTHMRLSQRGKLISLAAAYLLYSIGDEQIATNNLAGSKRFE
jgi:hypothetical protein